MSSFLLSPILCYNKYGGKMRKIKKKKRKRRLLIFLVLLIIFSICGYFIYMQYNDVRKTREMFRELDGTASITSYTVYGNHLNMQGSIVFRDSIDKMSMVLKNINSEQEFPLIYHEEEHNYEFYLSSKINDGIDLESIGEGEYYIFLKMYIGDQIKYYSLTNETTYEDVEYYALTRNNHNNKIKLHIDDFKLVDKTVNYFKLICKKQSGDNEVYDIVIDPGHGGKDSGAISLNNKYKEADITLDIAKKLKEELEKIGLRVKLTRDKDETLNSYGNNGRAVIANKVKAKLLLSLHLNSNEFKITKGGLEIYIPNDFNLALARLMADNIVSNANTTYSVNQTDRIEQGIYMRTFTQSDIVDARKQANEIGYEPYNITNSTPSLYMLRETGGIMTHAYIDGRNPNYNKNPYYDSNIAAEAYLLELGFINNDIDLNNILNNSELYVRGIVQAICEHYNLK